MPLDVYRRKRRFDVTPEPAGTNTKAAGKRGKSAGARFVVQKHQARRLHYDFRLEMDGVLKSWAVPKGPSLDPHEKRLAVETEDHPLEYAKFEGQIPEGEYGAGDVIIWDRGTWKPLTDPHAGYKKGHLEFQLRGAKLGGAWMLVRIRGRMASEKKNWLLIKRSDEASRPQTDYDVTEQRPESVKSGRLLDGEERPPANTVKAARPRAKRSISKPGKGRSRSTGKSSAYQSTLEKTTGARRAELPPFVPPQLATLSSQAPVGSEWLHEIKFDGYRLLCRVDGGHARLVTRNKLDWTHRYPSIARDAERLPVQSALFDGELVALLENGLSSFQALQNARTGPGAAQLMYFAFDLLHLDGYDLRQLPLEKRKEVLAGVLADSELPGVKFSEHFDAPGPEVFEQSCRMGLEGIISKRRDRPYISGRTDDWIKTKCIATEELVIGGYTLSDKAGRQFGALLVGYFQDGKLNYAGRIGTGFNAALLRDLRKRLDALTVKESPFVSVPAKERGARVRWVQPQLVAQVEFIGWTDSGVLRHPSFQGLREDKPASEITRPPSLKQADPMTTRQQPRAQAKPKAAAAKSAGAKASKPRSHSKLKQSPADIAERLTNPDRVLFPESQITKLDLATYYAEIADYILPHLADRPLSLVRCPEGIAKARCFYQKHATPGTPDALRRIDIQEKHEVEQYLIADDVEGLIALAQMSILEIHPWGSRGDRIDYPDRLFFDLDPAPEVPWQRVIDAALLVRELLEKNGLTAFVKTTGGKGLHVVVPLSPRRTAWPEAKQFSRGIAQWFADQSPQLFTAVMSKAQRRGKIFIDYLRNDRGATAVAPYSTRAKPGAPVSVPLAWEELDVKLRSDHYTLANIRDRLKSLRSDPWKGFFDLKQTIPSSS